MCEREKKALAISRRQTEKATGPASDVKCIPRAYRVEPNFCSASPRAPRVSRQGVGIREGRQGACARETVAERSDSCFQSARWVSRHKYISSGRSAIAGKRSRAPDTYRPRLGQQQRCWHSPRDKHQSAPRLYMYGYVCAYVYARV